MSNVAFFSLIYNISALIFYPLSISAQQSPHVRPLSLKLPHEAMMRDFCLSSDGQEAYMTMQSLNESISQIVRLNYVDNSWGEPELLAFCDQYKYLEPFLTHDGKKLYFVSNRPKSPDDGAVSDFDIWYVERPDIKSRWSDPINMGAPVNSSNDEFYPTLAANNNLYFTMDAKEGGMGKDDIYFCTWDGTTYAAPQILPSPINSDGYEFNAFIAPDESYLIYSKYKSEDGYGSGDLYLSRRNAETGQWQTAVNLGTAINSAYMEYCPYYDAEHNILYFTSRRYGLETRKFADFKQFYQYLNEGETGMSKIYWCKIEF